MTDYFNGSSVIDQKKVINAIMEIDEKRLKETDESKKTQLMMEQMLRGLYLQMEDNKF